MIQTTYPQHPGSFLKESSEVIKNQLLLKVFGAVDGCGIRYCLLRGLDELALDETDMEIDLLVDPHQLKAFRDVVARQGFVPLPSWGYAPHQFYVAYDENNDIWLKLDVVTDLVYGRPIRHIQIDSATRCLSRRYRLGPIYVLSIEDEFITLLLHCILDKAEIRSNQRERLKTLYDLIAMNPKSKERIETHGKRYLPNGITWNDVARLIERDDWWGILKHRIPMDMKLFQKQPLMNSWRWFRSRLIRRLRPFLFVLRCHGISVALLAPDGAGKSTLAGELTHADYLRARLIYMGTNSDAGNIGLPTTRRLKERVKSLGGNRNRPKGFLVRGLNYLNRLLEQWFRYAAGFHYKMSGRIVIFDRYAYDNYLAPPAKSLGKRARRWLLKNTCPSPDLVILLDAPGEILFRRKGEHSPERLEEQRRVYLALKNKIPNMVVVDATRSVNDVRSDVISRIWNFYGCRLLKRQ